MNSKQYNTIVKRPKGWGIRHLVLITSIMIAATSTVYAVPATLSGSCGLATPGDTTGTSLFYPLGGTDGIMSSNGGLAAGVDARFCIYPSPPTIAQLDTNCITQGETDNQTNYVIMVEVAGGGNTEYCLYQYDINTANADVRINAAVAVPAPAVSTPVPIFTPLGLLVTMFGLMWFGKRRRK